MVGLRKLLAAVLVMAFAGAAMAEDSDIRELQARLAAQEARMADQDARMNDLQAKIASGGSRNGDATADNVVSLRKNAKVTVGGMVLTKYTFTDATHDTDRPGENVDLRAGDFAVTDAYLNIQVDVNDYFDAFFSFDMQNGDSNDYYNAEIAYIRWKNLCETGFGLKIGRDALVFGDSGIGELGGYTAGSGEGMGDIDGIGIPAHNGWDVSGVTQITPYWEGMDGRLSFELSFMQHVYEGGRVYASAFETGDFGPWGGLYQRGNKLRSRNYGIGTMSARMRYSPIENLNFTLSAANYRSNGSSFYNDPINDPDNYVQDYSDDHLYNKNNTVYGLAVNYRPSALNRLYMWAQWVHGENVDFIDGLKSDAINLGLSFDLTEGLTWFAQGDYLRSKYRNLRGTAWAFYTGLQYSLPYGVYTELGWKHEWATYKTGGVKNQKDRANTLYGLVGFEF